MISGSVGPAGSVMAEWTVGSRNERQKSMIATSSRIQHAGSPAKWQFGVSSLLWLMATIGMCLAFARPFGMSAVMLVIFAPLGAVLAGLAFGKPGVRQQAIYWAVVCSALGAISVVPVRLDLLTFVFW